MCPAVSSHCLGLYINQLAFYRKSFLDRKRPAAIVAVPGVEANAELYFSRASLRAVGVVGGVGLGGEEGLRLHSLAEWRVEGGGRGRDQPWAEGSGMRSQTL